MSYYEMIIELIYDKIARSKTAEKRTS